MVNSSNPKEKTYWSANSRQQAFFKLNIYALDEAKLLLV